MVRKFLIPFLLCSVAWSQTITGTHSSGGVRILPGSMVVTISGTCPNGSIGAAYFCQLTASGGSGTYTWSQPTGSLPSGTTLNTSTGAISGTATAIQTVSFTLVATDSHGTPSAPYPVTISILSTPLQITSGSPPNGQVTIPYGPFGLTATGGVAPYSWTVTSGSLCSGLSIVGSSIQGTPLSAQTCQFKVTVTDNVGAQLQSGPNPYTVVIIPAPAVTITSACPGPGVVGVAYGPYTITASGGTAPYTFNITNPPPGLGLNPINGTFSGTPSTAGSYGVAITATDFNGTVSSPQNCTINISSAASAQISLPQAWANNHECDTALTSPVITLRLKADGSGDYPYTCAGYQSALNQWAADTDKAYLLIYDVGSLPAVSGSCIALPPKQVATQNGCFATQSSSPAPRGVAPCAGANGVNGTRNLGCPANIGNFLQMSTTSVNTSVIITNNAVDGAGNGPRYFLLQDFAVSPATTVTTANAPMNIGTGAETTIAQLPSHIHLQYFYVHGDAGDTFTAGTPPGNNIIANGFTFNCPYCSAMWFQTDKLTRPGAEGHDVAIVQNTGPYKICCAWIEGSSSGIFHGGQAPAISGVVSAQDGEERMFRDTYPMAWIGANWGSGNSPTRKNAWEMKEGIRVLMSGFILENVDQTGGQGAPCSDLDVRQTSGGGLGSNYLATIHDIRFENFIDRNCLSVQNDARSGGAGNGGGVALPGYNARYYNGLLYNMNGTVFCVGGGTCTPYRTPALSASRQQWLVLSAARDGSTGNITANLASSTGQTQSNMNVGDPTLMQSCSDSTFNTQIGVLGPAALSGTSPTGLTVVYNNGSTGAASTFSFIASASPTSGNAGTGYQAGDVLAVIESGASGGTVTVATVSGGVPQTYTVAAAGQQYQSASGLTTTGGHGSGAQVTITAGGCQFYNQQGYWQNFQWSHMGVIANLGSTSSYGPYIASCPINTVNAFYGRNVSVQDSYFALDAWGGFFGNGAAEGSSGANGGAEACLDLPSFNFHHVAFAERNGANYTAYPSGLKGNVAGSNLWFPATPQCSSTTPDSACMGMPAMLSGVFNQNPTDYHQFELCGGQSSPAGCAGPSVFATGQSQQASDGTDLGPNVSQIDAAENLNLYVCDTPCGSGPYPNIGKVVIVDPSGNDSNNGTALTPVATLNGARALVAGTDGSLVLFNSGFYPNTSTTFTAGDSGTTALPITYRCAANPCTLSGGVKVTGWANCDGVTHCKNLPSGAFSCSGCQTPVFVLLASASFTNFEQLWYNGVRRYRPRSPYTDPSTGIGTWYLQGSPGGALHEICASASSPFFPTIGGCPSTGGNNFECFGCYQRDAGDTQTIFHGLSQFSPADDCTAPGTAPGIHDVEIVAMENWTNSRMRLCNKISDGTNVFALTSTQLPATGLTTSGASGTPPSATCSGTCNFGPLAGHNYFLDNVLEAMLHKQQWYLDRCPSSPTCASSVEATWELIYIPATGETPNSDTVIIPQVQAPIVDAGGTNLAFDGLTIANSNMVVPVAGLPGTTDSVNISAGVSFRTVTGITLRNIAIQNMGGWALEFIGSPALQSAFTHQFINSTMFDIGSGGMRIGAQETTSDTSANVAQFVKVQNVFCKGIQRFMAGEAGCFSVQNAHDNLVTQTSAKDTYNLAYAHGGSQGFAGLGHIQANNNTFSFVEADTVGQGVTSDDSAFHAHSGGGTGNSLQYFVFHDVVQGVENNSFFTSYNGYSGPYLDNSTSFFAIGPGLSYNGSEGTMLIDSASDGLGQGNVITNVILAYGRSGLVKRGSSNFTLTNSIGYFDKGNSMNGVQYEGGSQWLCPALPCAWTFNQNTWFNFANSLGSGTPWYVTISGVRNYFSSAQWCSMWGEDCGSTFTTNPGFVAPTCAGGYNFNFSGTMPATFTSFNLASAGSSMPEPPNVPAAFPTFVPNCNTYY